MSKGITFLKYVKFLELDFSFNIFKKNDYESEH